MATVTAAPRSLLPVTTFSPSATTPPMMAITPPAVGDTALAITSTSSSTTCGSAADSVESRNRLTPRTSSSATYSGTERLPAAIRAAVAATNVARSSADQTRIWRRDQRSISTPANGPTSEYGRYKTVNDAAPAAGLGNVEALKNT